MATTINITNSGSGAYLIDNVSNGDISLIRGNTYNLVINATGHPFWIQTVPGGYSSNNIYSSGITNNGTESGTITFVVPNDAPNTLYYACRFHSSMQGRIIITGQVNKTNPTLTNFTIPIKNVGDVPFTIIDPSSNSSGSFSYSSSNESVATIVGNTITIIGVGTSFITATQASNENYTSATITTEFQVDKANPTLTNFNIPTKNVGDISFTIIDPSSNSTGSFSYSSSNESVATISGTTITIVGAGTSTITATQASTQNYTSTTITTEFVVDKANPTITNFTIPIKNVGDIPFTIIDPSSNSTGSFSYSSSNTSVATIVGTTITIVGAGTSIITATQEATTNYNSRTNTTQFQVDKADPTMTNFAIPTKTYGDSAFIIPSPSSNSTGSFSYSSSNTSVATISGTTITIVGAGTSTITATQEATTNYNSRTNTTQFQVDKANPTITNFAIPTKTYGDSAFTMTPPSSNSIGSFSYSSSNESVATIFGNTITIVGAGTSIITATQSETTNYNSATILRQFQVDKANPTMTNFAIPTKTYGDSDFTLTPPTSNSSGLFSYSSSNTSVARISENTITIIGAGTSTITATQSETSNYIPATIITQLQVNKANPMIFFTIPTITYEDSPFTIPQPTSNSTGSFSYSSSNTSVATIFENKIIVVNTGNSNITVMQEETANYTSATTKTQVQVNKYQINQSQVNPCVKSENKINAIKNSGTRNYIIKQIQKKQNYQNTLQLDEYTIQLEQYIQDIMNLQNQNPTKSLDKIIDEYIKNI